MAFLCEIGVSLDSRHTLTLPSLCCQRCFLGTGLCLGLHGRPSKATKTETFPAASFATLWPKFVQRPRADYPSRLSFCCQKFGVAYLYCCKSCLLVTCPPRSHLETSPTPVDSDLRHIWADSTLTATTDSSSARSERRPADFDPSSRPSFAWSPIFQREDSCFWVTCLLEWATGCLPGRNSRCVWAVASPKIRHWNAYLTSYLRWAWIESLAIHRSPTPRTCSLFGCSDMCRWSFPWAKFLFGSFRVHLATKENHHSTESYSKGEMLYCCWGKSK